MTTYGAALAAGRAVLERAGVPSAALDSRLLLAAAAGIDMAALIARGRDPLPSLAQMAFDAHLRKRTKGVPVARILGEKEFWGRTFKIDAPALVPRPDTETLVEAVLDEIGAARSSALRICDLGTGSGVIVISLLLELPAARGVAVDISEGALAVARENAKRFGVADRIAFRRCDFAEVPDGPFDVVVANPPYVESGAIAGLAPDVREHDPRIALDGGPDGLAAYRTILAHVGRLVADGGLVAFELGQGQGGAVAALCSYAGLDEIRVRADLSGIDRVVTARLCGKDRRRDKKLLGKVALSG